jgi:hypothetical protein
MGVGVEEPIISFDRTVRLSVCSENQKPLACLERFDYYVTTSTGLVCKETFSSSLFERPANWRRRSAWTRKAALDSTLI